MVFFTDNCLADRPVGRPQRIPHRCTPLRGTGSHPQRSCRCLSAWYELSHSSHGLPACIHSQALRARVRRACAAVVRNSRGPKMQYASEPRPMETEARRAQAPSPARAYETRETHIYTAIIYAAIAILSGKPQCILM